MEMNYHHLRYFREVAHTGTLTGAAARLNLSQSALSTQIRQLEARLGHALFERRGRALILTEAGRIALDHADRIFAAGDELQAVLAQSGGARRAIRVGAISTLSRNFQLQFLRPLIGRADVEIILRSGNAAGLLDALQAMALDVMLTTEAPPSAVMGAFVAHPLSEQKVALIGTPHRLRHATLAETLAREPVILPTESSIRTGFDSLVARLGLSPQVVAEVDDMAMVRLLARADAGLAVTPTVVMADELAQGTLATAPFDLDIQERFFAITLRRQFPNPLLGLVLPFAGGPEAGRSAAPA